MYVWMLLSFVLLSCEPVPKSTQGTAETETIKTVDPAHFREALQLTDLAGNPLAQGIFDDKILILNLWATWCGPCVSEMPDLEKMQVTLGEDFILLLASDESRAKINRFVNKRDINLNFVQIQNSLESLGVYSLPTTFIVGADGQLKETLIGAREWNKPSQINMLKTFLP